MEDVRSFQDELALSVSKDYVTEMMNRNNKFNATEFDDIKKYIPSFTKDYEGKLKIENDELVYVNEKITENEKVWLKELGIKTENFAKIVEENPTKYYGEYITNYKTGNDNIDNEGQKWQIFHSDGENIYLISDDYIKYDYTPNGKGNNGHSITHGNTDYKLSFDDVIQDYEGSKDIINDSKARKWISWVSKYPNSTNNNIKAVAYMLDTNAWKNFAGDKAEYAIGGPTLEMFVASYNKTHTGEVEQLECKEMINVGYKIKKGNGVYTHYCNDLPTNNEFNSLYVITDKTKTPAMWLASPCSISVGNLYFVYDDGKLTSIEYNHNEGNPGFRPVVCLKSDISLKKVSDGFEIE